MAAMKKTHVDGSLLQTLKTTSWTSTLLQGLLFGQSTPEGTYLVGVVKTNEDQNQKFDQTYVEKHLAGGLEIFGIVIFCKEDQPTQNNWQNVKSILSSSEPVSLDDDVLVCVINKAGISFYWLPDEGNPQKIEVVVQEINILSQSVLAQTKIKLPLTVLASNHTENCFNLRNEIEKLCLDFTDSGSYIFQIVDSPVLITSEDIIGLKKTETANSLLEYLKGGKSQKSGQQDTLSINVLQRLSSNNILPTCAPFIHHNIGEKKCFTADLQIDVIYLLPFDMPVRDLYKHFTDKISLQLEHMLDILDENKNGDQYFQPEVFHFKPLGANYFLSIVYPNGLSEDSLESKRKELHEVFCLPSDKPMLRRSNKYIFGGEEIPGGYLLNPHTAINVNPLKESKFYLVQGNYTYHHYMQDDFDDNKWGCAYRSLQTLVSWFRFQGYTDKPVPRHKEVQQCLVDIGDKDPKFVGSQKWIGSLEVSYCLENLIGVTCKIISVSSGAELANKGRELSQHFLSQGTPIMIGGGVLAHTILGVNFSEVTGDLKFLILDPHFTGGENLREIIDKGWCGWKGTDFWDQTAMYNMCLPQRPNMI